MVQKYSAFLTIFLIIFFIAMIIPACIAATSPGDALTRGSQFTVIITGAPNTDYYLWLTRTYTLTGNPGDQPPVIVGGQGSVQKDPPEGPYTIGMYEFNNGNGRTIRDDVAPSTPDMPNTNYYALITTDRDGRAVVAFQTSSLTATRTFSIKAENPQSSATVFIEQGLPVKITTTPATTSSPLLSTIPTTTHVTTIPKTSPQSATLMVTTIPGPISTPTQSSPSGIEVGIIAIITGLFLAGKSKFFH